MQEISSFAFEDTAHSQRFQMRHTFSPLACTREADYRAICTRHRASYWLLASSLYLRRAISLRDDEWQASPHISRNTFDADCCREHLKFRHLASRPAPRGFSATPPPPTPRRGATKCCSRAGFTRFLELCQSARRFDKFLSFPFI